MLPKPVALIGALVNEKPNFFVVADLSTSGYKIPRFVVSSGKNHYTNDGIIQNKSFSVNIPSQDMVEASDFCGIKSGKKVDKSNVFEVFYGKLKTAPMIKEAPITHSCKLVKTIDFGDTHYIFIGEIIESYTNEECFTKSIPDIEKVRPFTWYYDNKYYSVGKPFADAYKIGRNFLKE